MLNMSSSSASSSSPSPSSSPPTTVVAPKRKGVRSSSNSPAVSMNQGMRRADSPAIDTLSGPETHFSCAYKNNGLFHGKLCISKTNFAFKSITGFSIVIKCVDVARCMKRNTAFVFPNAIELTTVDRKKFLFTSFLNRDQAYDQILSRLVKKG